MVASRRSLNNCGNSMNFEQARYNMIEQQIRPWDVLCPETLQLMGSIPREAFVPPNFRHLAYADTEIPLPHGSVMRPPREIGRALQALALQSSDIALDVGTGTGYLTALMAQLAAHVTSIELHPDLQAIAKRNLDEQQVHNITLQESDASQGWNTPDSFDAICITGGMPQIPQSYLDALRIGGRLFAIIGKAPAMQAVIVRKSVDQHLSQETLFETVSPWLEGLTDTNTFSF